MKKEVLHLLREIEAYKNNGENASNTIYRLYLLGSETLGSLIALLYMLYLFFFTGQSLSFAFTILLLFAFAFFILFEKQFTAFCNRKRENIQKDVVKSLSMASYYSSLSYDVSKGKDIRIFGIYPFLKDRVLSLFKKQLDTIHQFAAIIGINNGGNAFALQLFSGIAFFYVGLKALNKDIAIGDVLLYTGTITQFSTLITKAFGHYSEVDYCFRVVLTKEQDFIKSNDLSYDGTLPIEKRDDNEYHFQFKDVSFKYPGTEKLILNHFNFDFHVGKSYAIVGQNGAGKTTLVKLLCRLYEPTSGEILLNGINIQKYDYREYTDIFSVVFQDFKLFALPLDENIAGSKNVNKKRVEEVTKQVGIYDHFASHKDGLSQLLYKETGDGVTVSGGEAQKIAIARALYKDAPFVILDEPTSALDPISEVEVYENFHQLIKNKTAIYISHRMSSCRFCDYIVVLENGKIEEFGNHESLMGKNGLYTKLWKAQSQYYQ